MSERLVPQQKLVSLCAACLEKLGLAAPDANLVAQTLVAANLRGGDSHGVVRLPDYATRLRNGAVRPRPDRTLPRAGAPPPILGGDAGTGQLVATRARQGASLL